MLLDTLLLLYITKPYSYPSPPHNLLYQPRKLEVASTEYIYIYKMSSLLLNLKAFCPIIGWIWLVVEVVSKPGACTA